MRTNSIQFVILFQFYRINIKSDSHDLGVGCLVRGNPNHFDQSKLLLDVVDQHDCKLSYDSQEELVSCILRFTPTTDSGSFQVRHTCLYIFSLSEICKYILYMYSYISSIPRVSKE